MKENSKIFDISSNIEYRGVLVIDDDDIRYRDILCTCDTEIQYNRIYHYCKLKSSIGNFNVGSKFERICITKEGDIHFFVHIEDKNPILVLKKDVYGQ